MAVVRTGLEYVVSDKATPAIKGMARGASAAFKSMSGAAAKAGAALKAVGVASTLINQTLELGKKSWEMFRLLVLDTVSAAADFRAENDRALQSLKGFAKSLSVLRARVGDALIPVLRALAETLQPVIDAVSRWFRENQKMIASKLGNWVITMAEVITTNLLPAIKWASAAFAGWEVILNTVRELQHKFVAAALSGFGKMLGAAAQVAAALGRDGLAGSRARLAAKTMAGSEAFRKMGTDAEVSALQAKNKHKAFAASIDETTQAIHDLSDEARKALEMATNSAVAGGQRTREETAKLLEARQRIQAEEAANIEMLLNQEFNLAQRRHQLREEDLKRHLDSLERKKAADKAAADAKQAQMEAIGQEAGRQVATLTMAAVEGEKEFQAAFVGMLKNTMDQVIQELVRKAVISITASASEGAASAAAANAGIPGVGPALAAAAGSAMLALIMGYKSTLLGFNKGGLVPGVGNRDTVPAMLTPGEVVVPAPVVKQIANGGGSQPVSLNVSLNSMAPPTNRADYRKQLRDIMIPELKRLIRNGELGLA